MSVDEQQGRSFAPLRINSGNLLIINLIMTIIRFMTIIRLMTIIWLLTIIRAPEPFSEDTSDDRLEPAFGFCVSEAVFTFPQSGITLS